MERKDIVTKKIPDTPGVYFFLGASRKILYIGKAGSLRDRVRSYFTKDIFLTRGPGIEHMVAEARGIDFIKTDSVLEALILEANLIKKHKPKYNIREKDDKSFNYVVITKEDFPIIKTMRGKDLSHGLVINLKSKIFNLKFIFGPFPEGKTLKEALRIVRKIFPFRDDTCTLPRYSSIMQNTGIDLAGGNRGKIPRTFRLKPCFNRHIGLCPGTCTGEITKKEYQKTIRNIQLLFEGKKGKLLKTLEGEMKQAARAHEFEKAGEIRNKIFSLKHIRDISLIKRAVTDAQTRTYRVEAYDVAHMAGRGMVGVMAVLEDGELVKSEYRKFILKTVTTPNDPGALKEVFSRRLKHNEWRLPDLIVVDGGKAQINVVQKLLQGQTLERVIHIVGVVKNEFHKPKRLEGNKEVTQRHEREIVFANAEAHRFAIKFHRQQIRKKFIRLRRTPRA